MKFFDYIKRKKIFLLIVLILVGSNVWAWYPFVYNFCVFFFGVNMSETLLAALVGGFFGVAGASVAAFGAYRITKRQITADVISTATGLYINNLRETVADYQAVLMLLERRAKAHANVEDEVWNKFNFLFGKLKLLTNPELKEDKQLIEAIEGAALNAKEGGTAFVDFQDRITEVARQLLLRDWNKVQTVAK